MGYLPYIIILGVAIVIGALVLESAVAKKKKLKGWGNPNWKAVSNIASGELAELRPGHAMQLEKIPVGTVIHNIELRPGKGGQMVRSAGTSAQLVAKEGNYVTVRLPSGEMRKIHQSCMATLGQVGNAEHGNVKIGKAGRARWLGWRPSVRGSAQDPSSHPHGGGEGRTSGGRHPVTPWGVPTKGYKTRKNKRTDSLIVRRRNKK
mgnify:CR=1 FL=1